MKNGLADAKSAYITILLLGIVSLLGDVVYEGSRGLIPDYLRFLGASAFIVGFVGGSGEFIGYAMRLVGGVLADATRAYWPFMFLGYGLIVSIPFLGFTRGWELAAILVLLERLGKALRSPSRDTVLSIVSKGIGAGKAFGLHELLDQVGAMAGPLIVALLMLYSANDYRYAFSLFLLPFTALMVFLVYTYKKIGQKTVAGPEKVRERAKVLGRPFYVYTLAVLFNTVGLLPVPLILYKASAILQPEQQQWIVPLIYLLVQGVDASIALLSGYAYDRLGVKVLAMPFFLSTVPPLLTLAFEGLSPLVAAAVFFGLVLGMQESIYRAAVSEFAPISSRGTAYGIFNTAYGVGFLISGAIYGMMIDLRLPFIITLSYAILTQTIAITSLFSLRLADLKPEGA